MNGLQEQLQTLSDNPTMQALLDSVSAERQSLIERIITIQQIPAPTFAEGDRAAYVESLMQTVGLVDVSRDEVNNVYGRLPGTSRHGLPIVISAHSDTVFPAATDLSIRREGNRIYGPGIADNSAGVGAILTAAELMRRHQLKLPRDVWFAVNVAEEGLGDLKGMRHVVQRFGGAAHAYIIVEGGMYGYLLHQAIGVRRYEITVTGQGGHSWSDFGTPSAIHHLGRLIAALDAISVPSQPKTTFNVGLIDGGTSINTIAAEARLLLDLRSESPAALQRLVGQVQAIVQAEANGNGIDVKVRRIGSRPAGEIPRSHWLVQLADAALRHAGCERIQYLRGSTDANIPLSRGYPAVVVGLAQCANAHRLDEYLDTSTLDEGLTQIVLLLVAAAHAGP